MPLHGLHILREAVRDLELEGVETPTYEVWSTTLRLLRKTSIEAERPENFLNLYYETPEKRRSEKKL